MSLLPVVIGATIGRGVRSSMRLLVSSWAVAGGVRGRRPRRSSTASATGGARARRILVNRAVPRADLEPGGPEDGILEPDE